MPFSLQSDSFNGERDLQPLRTVTATRYVTPLREGGSLPAVVEADDDGLYVLKFRGAGQGQKALIAELLGGEIARALGLLVPEIVFVELDPRLGRSEPDPEIQDLIQASAGLNLALDYLPGALAFDPLLKPFPTAQLASAIVWLDTYITNVDRTPRNVNMLNWHNRLWLIDHGASLYFHHTWDNYLARSKRPFVQIAEHVLLPFAAVLDEIDDVLASRLTPETLRNLVALIPERWLDESAHFATHEAQREAYLAYLLSRLEPPRAWVEEAIRAHAQLV
ncbi:MAG: aminotransferase class I and II [Chloroflexota bacterium]|nr:aminotransferase class I and II [Chloroflexota bacterium]